MNTYITLSCLLAVVVSAHASGYGYGGLGGYGGYGLEALEIKAPAYSAPIIKAPIYSAPIIKAPIYSVPIIKAPILGPAISTQNVYKAAPIPIVKSYVAPVITPVVKEISVAPIAVGGYGYGLDGGYGGYGGLGYGLGYGKGLDLGYGYGYGKKV